MKEIKLLNILFTKDFFTTSNEQCSEWQVGQGVNLTKKKLEIGEIFNMT